MLGLTDDGASTQYNASYSRIRHVDGVVVGIVVAATTVVASVAAVAIFVAVVAAVATGC